MKDLTLEIEIEVGDIIYNSVENVRYEVTSYPLNMEFNTPVAYLKPFPPYGISKKEFTMSIQAMIDLKYKLIKQKKM